MTSPRGTIQGRLRQRQRSEFVGRDDHVTLFRRNLAAQPDERIYIFNVFGQGGIGKTTLLRRFRELAGAVNALTALTNDDQTDILSAMYQIAAELARQGYKLRAFTKRYRIYCQRRQKLESEPDASSGFSALLTSIVVKAVLALVHTIPVGGGLADLVDGDAVASKAGEYITHKLRNNIDEIRLIREPVEALTSIWLADLNKIAQKAPVILFFDTYEHTSLFLDSWLRDLVGDNYGRLSSTIQLVIAGRNKLNLNRWINYESEIEFLSLEPFTSHEARAYLTPKHITDERIVEIILRLSGGLPLLVATLAAERPNDPTKVGDPSGTAVECFLSWTEDLSLRYAAVAAALPRQFNRDIIALLVEDKQVDRVFEWLKGMPFVEECPNGWGYHAVVREQMLRYKGRESPQSWVALHARLADHYQHLAHQLDPVEDEWSSDETWQALQCDMLYHRLCGSYQTSLSVALNAVLAALAVSSSAASQCASAIARAEEDANIAESRRWGHRIRSAFDADSSTHHEALSVLFTDLLNRSGIEAHHRATAFGWRGWAYIYLERLEDAEADLTRAIEFYSQDVMWLTLRGLTYFLAQRYAESLADLDFAIELDPEMAWAYALRGLAQLFSQRYQEALVDITRASELSPQDVNVLFLRALMYSLTTRYEEALADLTHLIKLNPQNARALKLRSMIYLGSAYYEEALADTNTAIALNSGDNESLMIRGVVYLALGRRDEALADLNAAISPDAQDAVELLKRGGIYVALGRYDEALADFNAAIQLNPQLPMVLTQHGWVYLILARYDEALADLDTAIEINPQDAWALGYRGGVYSALARHGEALADLDTALLLNPRNALALAYRGATYYDLTRYDEALADLTRAVELNPQDAWALSRRGATYFELERYQEALADLTRAVELNPQDAWAPSRRGATYFELEHYDEALADLSHAITLNPQDTWALVYSGATYGELERYQEALIDIARALELDPEYLWALTLRSAIFRELERYDEALADLTRAIKIDAENDRLFYERALVYLLCQDRNESDVDLTHALQLARQQNAQAPEDSSNTFNLALYLLVYGESDLSQQYYRDLAPTARISALRDALGDLDDYLASFPDNADARAIRDYLQSRIDRSHAPEQ